VTTLSMSRSCAKLRRTGCVIPSPRRRCSVARISAASPPGWGIGI
jgi:hypothetical protein